MIYPKYYFSKILRVQLGKIYHEFISQAERGVLLDDEKMVDLRELLKTKFDVIKDETKSRLRKNKISKKTSKSRKPRDNQTKPVNRRRMLYRTYMRS